MNFRNCKFKRKQKGFTLIELLVVIAIIGLLAGIVLVSLGGAQDSARDARITAALTQSRSLAELVASSNNGSYMLGGAGAANTDFCDAVNTLNQAHAIYSTELDAIEDDVLAQNSASALGCQADASNFCVYATLNNGQFYCVDSEASAGQTVTDPNADGLCLDDATPTFVCP